MSGAPPRSRAATIVVALIAALFVGVAGYGLFWGGVGLFLLLAFDPGAAAAVVATSTLAAVVTGWVVMRRRRRQHPHHEG